MAAVRLKATLAAALVAAGLFQFGQGVYIHAKAALAQALLERAWIQTLEGETQSRPWAWADTWPVARLKVPAHKVDQIVLDGGTGNVLAFAPGWLEGSAAPSMPGRVVISGHRDTHFRFLQDIAAGDWLLLQLADGGERRYRVVNTRVVDTREQNGFVLYPPADGLTLITCYPFDAVRPGGTLRYLVNAESA